MGVLMALLAVGLPTLHMQSGKLFLPQFSEQSTPNTNQNWGDLSLFLIVVWGLQIMLLLLLPIYIVLNLLTKRGRRRLLVDTLKIAFVLLIVIWISDIGEELSLSEEQIGLQSDFFDVSSISENANTLPEFEPDPQAWMLALIIVGVAALVGLITFFSLKSLTRRGTADGDHLQKFADTAQATLNDLEAAQFEFDNVIIQCYAEMTLVLQAERGLRREQAMTTHEFGQELLAKGFPARPVQQLTNLFEQVRYGHQQLEEGARQSAMESLRNIVDFCRQQV